MKTPTAAQIRSAGVLASKFPGRADRLRAFLELSPEEQRACFPALDIEPTVAELATTYLETGRFLR